MSYTTAPTDVFSHDTYVVRRKVLKLFGGAFHIYDAAGNLLGYSKMKAFKLKEDIRLYTNETMSDELLTIKARSIIDFSAAYDVVDSHSGQKLGALRRKGLKSMLKDEWELLNAADQPLGIIEEDAWLLALVRRFIDLAALIFPQKFVVRINGQEVATFKQNFNPFVKKLNVTFLAPPQTLDRRLGVAAALLMSAVEGRQQ